MAARTFTPLTAEPLGDGNGADAHSFLHGQSWQVWENVLAHDPNAGAGGTNASPAIQAAIDALGSNGGTVFLPPGTYRCDTALDLSDSRSIILRGAGGLSAGAAPATTLTFTVTGSGNLINARNTFGVWLDDLRIIYTSASFTGHVVDFSNQSGLDSAFGGVRRCYIGGEGVRTAAAGVWFHQAIIMAVRDCYILNCDVGIIGSATSYSSIVTVDHCTFNDNATCHIQDPVVAWTISDNTFEQTFGSVTNSITHTSGKYMEALNVVGNWFGDAGAQTSGAHITLLAKGANISGNLLAGNGGGQNIVFDEDDSHGVNISGNQLQGADKAIDFGSTTGHSRIIVSPNYFTGNNDQISGMTLTNVVTEIPVGQLIISNGTDGVVHGPGLQIYDTGSKSVISGISETDNYRGVTLAQDASSLLSFYGATPITKPVVTGSRTGETAADASQRAALVALGLITDSTTA